MKLPSSLKSSSRHATSILWLSLAVPLAFSNLPSLLAQAPPSGAVPSRPLKDSPEGIKTNAPPPAGVVPASGTPPPPPSQGNTPPAGALPAGAPGAAATEGDASSNTDEIQVSFQGANIDLVVQWIAKITGKSVVKHPRAQCQLTIVSSKKVSNREALNLVFRALSLEGFSTVETANSILIVPEGQDVKMNPEVLESSATEVPQGRQKLVKVFPLKNVQANELKDKIRVVLSEKATLEVVERSNQLVITDFNDNIRLLGELIKELDQPAGADSVIEFYQLKHGDAEEVASLLSLVLNAQAGTPGGSRSSSRSFPSSGGSPFPGGMPPSMGGESSPSSGGSSSSSPQSVKLWPEKTFNRLIISCPKDRLAKVKEFIEILDTAKPQDVSIRVLTLKNVNAEDLVRELGPLYQKLGSKSSKEAVEISANGRSNSLIIFSSEANFRTIEKLVSTLDTDDAQEKTTQSFPLKNADAEDVAKQIQDLNQDQDKNNSYPYFFFSSMSGNSKTTKKINVVADRRRNTVLVQAPPAAMESITKLVATLDEPLADNAMAPKIYRLKYVNAADIEEVLNELFLKKQQGQQQRNYYDYYNPFGNSQDDDKKGGKLFGKVRIISEPYANAIIISANSPENLATVEEVLQQLDSPSEAGETTFRVGLKFAKAVNVASSLNILFAKGGSPPVRQVAQPNQPGDVRQQQQQQANSSQNSFTLEQETKEEGYFPWLGGQQENTRGADGRTTTKPVSDLIGKVRVVPDRRINSVLISCNLHFLPQVMKLIEDLDAPTPQVLIEAKIIEVSSDFRERLGVRWSPDGAKSFDGSDMDNGLTVGNTGNSRIDLFKNGVLDTKVNLDLLIQFMRKNTDAKVLAEPQINIADNELGKLFVGAQVPFISGSLNTETGGRNDTFNYRDVGVILEVTPHINGSEEIALKIRAESSSIRSGETLFGGAILDTRNFRTDVMVKNGETVVLGGIIQREDTTVIRKTPFLGDIPGLGWAFKKKDKTTRDIELMVFLRPYVSRNPEQTKKILQEIERKAPLMNQWKNESAAEVTQPAEGSKTEKEKAKKQKK